MSDDAVTKFDHQLKYWQRDGFFVLLKNFYNIPDRNMGFVVSVNEADKEFVFKFYENKVLDERHYSYDQVDELIERMDKIIRNK